MSCSGLWRIGLGLALLAGMRAEAQAPAGNASDCGIRTMSRELGAEAKQFGTGLKSAPRNAIRPQNLAWELPVLAATGVMIAKADRPAVNHIQSLSLQRDAGRWSNIGIGLELGASGLAFAVGCGSHNNHLRDAGFTALTAIGTAGLLDLGLKLAFDRQYATDAKSGAGAGKFWGGGRSFPSGHAATSFAFASTVAHRYPHNKLVKWGSYALATAVSLSRYPAKKHFPSDILVGATLGYVTGAYLGGHTD